MPFIIVGYLQLFKRSFLGHFMILTLQNHHLEPGQPSASLLKHTTLCIILNVNDRWLTTLSQYTKVTMYLTDETSYLILIGWFGERYTPGVINTYHTEGTFWRNQRPVHQARRISSTMPGIPNPCLCDNGLQSTGSYYGRVGG